MRTPGPFLSGLLSASVVSLMHDIGINAGWFLHNGWIDVIGDLMILITVTAIMVVRVKRAASCRP